MGDMTPDGEWIGPRHDNDTPPPWRKVAEARWDNEETLECGHKWHLPLHDKITRHAKKRRCKECGRQEQKGGE